MRIAQEEIFGPVVSVIPCGSRRSHRDRQRRELWPVGVDLHPGHQSRLPGDARIYTGIFYVNAPTIGAEVHLPFGGTKAPATAIAKRIAALESSRNGSRSTSTSAANCSARRSIRKVLTFGGLTALAVVAATALAAAYSATAKAVALQGRFSMCFLSCGFTLNPFFSALRTASSASCGGLTACKRRRGCSTPRRVSN